MKFENMTAEDENLPLLRDLINYFINHRTEQGLTVTEDDLTIVNGGDGKYMIKDQYSRVGTTDNDDSAEAR